MGRTPPDSFREADLELIRELQSQLEIAKGWAWVWERATEIAVEFYHPYAGLDDHSALAIEECKLKAINEFRIKHGLGEL